MLIFAKTYRFFIRFELDSMGVVVPSIFGGPHSYTLSVKWWIGGLLAIFALGFLAWLQHYRMSKRREIEHMRLCIARDLHDDVGSSLSSIALTAELLQKELASNGLMNRQLVRVHETAQKLARNLKEIVWAIDPQKDKIGDLLLRMKEVAMELLMPHQIKYVFSFPENERVDKLPMEFRRNLYLIYKEALHNISKHSQATHVDIQLIRSNGLLTLKIADNGRGFDPAAANSGQGLKSLRTRAQELKGNMTITSQPGKGTELTFTVKIP